MTEDERNGFWAMIMEGHEKVGANQAIVRRYTEASDKLDLEGVAEILSPEIFQWSKNMLAWGQKVFPGHRIEIAQQHDLDLRATRSRRSSIRVSPSGSSSRASTLGNAIVSINNLSTTPSSVALKPLRAAQCLP